MHVMGKWGGTTCRHAQGAATDARVFPCGRMMALAGHALLPAAQHVAGSARVWQVPVVRPGVWWWFGGRQVSSLAVLSSAAAI